MRTQHQANWFAAFVARQEHGDGGQRGLNGEGCGVGVCVWCVKRESAEKIGSDGLLRSDARQSLVKGERLVRQQS